MNRTWSSVVWERLAESGRSMEVELQILARRRGENIEYLREHWYRLALEAPLSRHSALYYLGLDQDGRAEYRRRMALRDGSKIPEYLH